MKIPWGYWESNPGLLGEKRKHYVRCRPPPDRAMFDVATAVRIPANISANQIHSKIFQICFFKSETFFDFPGFRDFTPKDGLC